MTAISDNTISELIYRGELLVEPFDPYMVQPASIDLTLDHRFMVMTPQHIEVIDPYEDTSKCWQSARCKDPGEPFILHPRSFVLGSTVERIGLPRNVVGRLEGKSSLGRLGLLVHVTAGLIDPGFDGQITLEFMNVTPVPIRLWPGMKIAQMSLTFMDRAADHPYGDWYNKSKYQRQDGPTLSRYYLNKRPGE